MQTACLRPVYPICKWQKFTVIHPNFSLNDSIHFWIHVFNKGAVVEPEAAAELVEVDEVAAAVVLAAITEAEVVAAIAAEVLRNDRLSVVQMFQSKKT